ncbi:MAG TPA: hypothetical protein VLJ42_06795 [Solirubrobacteraceae bacterium]|nr:hypothetical protein [Solirubrobacteraceae bacterium]
MPADKDHHIRHQVQLPSGKQIEVVYFEQGQPPSISEPTTADSAHSVSAGDHGGAHDGAVANNAGERPATKREEQPRRAAASGTRSRRRAPKPAETTESLHVCPGCASELVYPLDWSEEGPRHWRVLLRCPDCESTREDVFPQATVERLDDELDRATGELLSDLKRMTHANMAAEIEFFIQALEADVILPSDF